MTKVVSGFIYYALYSFFYSLPLIAVMIADESLNLNLLKSLNNSGALKNVVGFIILSYMLILPGYRARLAADAYGDRDMKFLEAHSVSGIILKAHLSFLPVIGRFFEKK